ncbi:MAG: Ig-like domain-containing protein [Gemmatimonadaceae bacterium]
MSRKLGPVKGFRESAAGERKSQEDRLHRFSIVRSLPHVRLALYLSIWALSGCHSNELGVGITLGLPGYVSHGHLATGDVDTIRATAGLARGWPARLIFDSSTEPYRFRYSSSDTTIASVDREGRVWALSPGRAELRAAVGTAISWPLELIVSPPGNNAQSPTLRDDGARRRHTDCGGLGGRLGG